MNKKQRREFFRKLGAKGGRATAKRRGSEYMRQLARKGNKVRWSKRQQGDLSAL